MRLFGGLWSKTPQLSALLRVITQSLQTNGILSGSVIRICCAHGGLASTILALEGVPRTLRVTPENAQALWASRKGYFFKPAAGFGSRATYRGDKLTHRVWSEILKQDYIAQAFVPPNLRAVTVDDQKLTLKYDVRLYTYSGETLLIAARVYQGQTTNFRTSGGGFAVVYQC